MRMTVRASLARLPVLGEGAQATSAEEYFLGSAKVFLHDSIVIKISGFPRIKIGYVLICHFESSATLDICISHGKCMSQHFVESFHFSSLSLVSFRMHLRMGAMIHVQTNEVSGSAT